MFTTIMKRAVLCLLVSAACVTSTPQFTGFTDAGGDGITYGFDGGPTGSASTREADAPPSAHVRFADWTPDAPAAGYSFCLSPHGVQAWMGPFLPKGLAFPGTSTYSDVPPGTYDAQVVAASSGDCSTGILPMTTPLPSLADGTYATVAAIGDVTPTFEDPSMKLAVFVDDEAGTAGHALLRVLDAAPSLGYVNVGTGSVKTHDFRIVFQAASFGTPAMVTTGGQMSDPNGYVLLMPLSGVELSVQPLTTYGSDVATASNVSLVSGAAATLVVVGGKTGGPPPQIMMCDDIAAARGAPSPCNVFNH